MRVLVTGSEGTLGPHLVHQLEENGHEVWGCGRRHSARQRYIRCDVAEWRQVGLTFVECNPEVVFHLAAEFGRRNGAEYYEQMWRTNTIGTRNVSDACRRVGAHLVLASSSEAYGTLADAHDPLTEELLLTHAPMFHNEYALSKWANERQVMLAAANDDLRATILRFFNVYGPGESYTPYRSVVCQFMHHIMRGEPITVYEDATRDFLFVADWARTVAKVADAPQAVGEAINVGGTEVVRIADLARMIQATTGKRGLITYRHKEKANVKGKRPSLAKATQLLGHAPKVDLVSGLLLTHKWMESQDDAT